MGSVLTTSVFMPTPILIDTDVIIDYLRGRDDAVAFLEGVTVPLIISVVSVAELYAGIREGRERTSLETILSIFETIPVTDDIAVIGGLFRREFGRSHNVGLADALIAATAQVSNVTLVTLNKKHFPMLADVDVPYVKV